MFLNQEAVEVLVGSRTYLLRILDLKRTID
jgi:hypothetical protein